MDLDRETYYKDMDALNTDDLKLDVLEVIKISNEIGARVVLAHPIEIMEDHNLSFEDIDTLVEFGSSNLKVVNKWLEEKVHRHNGIKTPEEVLLYATGEKFNPKYYVKYLKEKYSKIYNLD